MAKQRKREMTQREADLLDTLAGAPLVKLIRQYPTKKSLAEAIGVNPQLVQRWLGSGKISRDGALLIESQLGIPKEELRPDLTADDWKQLPRGQRIGAGPVRNGKDQQLLSDIAAHFGSVRALSEVSGIGVSDFHQWMSRNRISGTGLDKLMGIALPDDLLARLKEAAQ